MPRWILALGACLAACSAADPERDAPVPTADSAPALPPVEEPAVPTSADSAADQPATPPREPVVEAVPAASAPADRPLPASIPLGSSVTRFGTGGKPTVTVSSEGGKAVRWIRSEVRNEPGPFDPGIVVATVRSADVWETSRWETGTVRVCLHLRGLPADALFLELDLEASEVRWADGSQGTLRGIHSQGEYGGIWMLDVLTSVPPTDRAIASLTVALDLHRSTRVERSEAVIGIDEAAAFDFGTDRSRWILSADLQVTEFGVRRHQGEPVVPFLRRGLRSRELVRLVDAKGNPLRIQGSGGAGSQSMTDWGIGGDVDPVPPVRVIVDVPLETVTTRVVVHLRDIRPSR